MSNHPKHGKHHPPANPKQDSTQKESTNRHVYIEPGAQIDVVQDLKDQHQAERGEDAAAHTKQLFWTKIAAVIVLLYTIISALQLCELRKSTTISMRSWIGLSNPAFNVGEYHQGMTTLGPIGPDVPLNANIWLENFGKTPADIDGIGFALEVRLDNVPEDFRYANLKRGTTVFPSQKIQTVSSDIVSISLPDFLLVKKQTERLVLHGIIRYHDTFGNHETKFCLLWSGEDRDFIGCLEHSHAN
jgi:hypothetical protein